MKQAKVSTLYTVIIALVTKENMEKKVVDFVPKNLFIKTRIFPNH